jgi:DNA repair protein RadC
MLISLASAPPGGERSERVSGKENTLMQFVHGAAVILAHNHPSGVAEPSHADEILTRSLKAALALVDIQVLDHFIVAGTRTMSFAERGLL